MKETARQHFLRSEELRKEGKINASIDSLQTAIRIAPSYAAAHHNLGFLYDQKNKKAKALAEYKEAIRLNPKLEQAYINMGALLINSAKQGKYTEAINLNCRAVSLSPRSVKLHYNLGVAYAGAGQRALAISEYREAIRCDPTFRNAYANLGNELARDKNWTGAEEALQQALNLGPDKTALRYVLCGVLIQLNRTNEAIGEFKTILRANPQDAEGLFQLGRAYLIQALQERNRESVRLAEESLNKAFALKPYSLQTIRLLLQIHQLRMPRRS